MNSAPDNEDHQGVEARKHGRFRRRSVAFTYHLPLFYHFLNSIKDAEETSEKPVSIFFAHMKFYWSMLSTYILTIEENEEQKADDG